VNSVFSNIVRVRTVLYVSSTAPVRVL